MRRGRSLSRSELLSQNPLKSCKALPAHCCRRSPPRASSSWSFLAAAPPPLLAAVSEPGWTMALLTGGLLLISDLIMGQVVEPLVYGHGTGLSPVAVILSTVFWTWLWRPLGLLLAIPLTVCLVVLGRHVEGLNFLEVLLGDKPALTPAQSFYQRALTGDSA